MMGTESRPLPLTHTHSHLPYGLGSTVYWCSLSHPLAGCSKPLLSSPLQPAGLQKLILPHPHPPTPFTIILSPSSSCSSPNPFKLLPFLKQRGWLCLWCFAQRVLVSVSVSLDQSWTPSGRSRLDSPWQIWHQVGAVWRSTWQMVTSMSCPGKLQSSNGGGPRLCVF